MVVVGAVLSTLNLFITCSKQFFWCGWVVVGGSILRKNSRNGMEWNPFSSGVLVQDGRR